MQQTTKHPIRKMFWGCFSYHGTGSLVHVDRMMNINKCMPILAIRMVPELKKLGSSEVRFFKMTLPHAMPPRK
jgi:hypothetical protein